MMYTRIAGVYSITNLVNGHRYIGSSVNISCRWNEHKRKLRNGEHHSVYLQRAWNKYGEDAFSFEILRRVSGRNNCITIEQEFIDNLKPEYNIAPKAISPGGFEMTEETREKHRRSAARLVQDPVWLEKVTQALRRGQPKAVAWRKSEAGREQSRKNYATTLALTHVDRLLVCVVCGKEYLAEKGKYCSGACASKLRRSQGVDNETRTCTICGKSFVVSRFRKTSTCSRSCSQSRPIVRIDASGIILNEYKNAHEASLATGIDNSSISKCIKGKYQSAGNYIWRYAESECQ